MALTADPARGAERALAAAQASLQAGAFDNALDLVAAAEAGPLDESRGARADLLRGQTAFASGAGSDAPPLLLKAARRLEPLDPGLARQTYADAWQAAQFAGHLAGAADLQEVSRAARALPPAAHPPRPVDLLLDGLALMITDGPAVAAPALRQATSAFASADIPAEDLLRWGWLAGLAQWALWDNGGRGIAARQVQLARDAGALDRLPFLLNQMATDATFGGDFAAAALLIAEAEAVCQATGSRLGPYPALMLASFRGRSAEAAPLIQSAIEDATAAGQGAAVTWALWAEAILGNGLSRYQEALAAARYASENGNAYLSMRVLPELIEAAARTGNPQLAGDALALLAEWTRAGGTEAGLGIEARSRALLSDGHTAEGYHREAVDRLGRTWLRPQLARAHLLYGEWLRREGRRADAREQLRAAHDQFAAIGMEAFAERARRELIATGERVRKRSAETRDQLTPQEEQIAKRAGDGHTNQEIAAQLFLSARTVEWHLSKVFGKLGVSSRRELHQALTQSRHDG